jgi:hypothetical protein
MSFTIIFKIRKMLLKSHFLFICCYKVRHHKAVIRQPLTDQNHYTAWAHKSIYILAVIACRRIRECARALSSCYSVLRRSRCAPLCVVLLVRACVPCVLPVIFRNMDFPWPQQDDGQCTEMYQRDPKMRATGFSLRLVPTHQSTRRHISKDLNFGI